MRDKDYYLRKRYMSIWSKRKVSKVIHELYLDEKFFLNSNKLRLIDMELIKESFPKMNLKIVYESERNNKYKIVSHNVMTHAQDFILCIDKSSRYFTPEYYTNIRNLILNERIGSWNAYFKLYKLIEKSLTTEELINNLLVDDILS